MAELYALYARISTDTQNIEQQIKAIKDYCKQKGLQVRTYRDEGFSGKLEDRPVWLNLINHIKQGRYKGVIVYNTDRVTRDGHYAYHFLNIFDKHDFEFISVTDPCDLKTEDGRFNFKIKCLLSEHELDKLKRRSRLGIERAKKEGKYLGRKPGSKNKSK